MIAFLVWLLAGLACLFVVAAVAVWAFVLLRNQVNKL